MRVRQQLVTGAARKTYSGRNRRLYITIHETGNTSKGANARAHANLQSRGNSRQASWHWTVDDVEAVQSYEHTAQCWHSGKGRDTGNLDSIAIEICVNSDGNYTQAVANAIELTKQIMRQENIPASNVVQHNKWSGKNCPTKLRKSGWAAFKAALTAPSKEKDWLEMATEADLRRVVKEELANLLNTVINSNPSSGKPSTLKESIAIACNYAYRDWLQNTKTPQNVWGYVAPASGDKIDMRQRVTDIHEGLGLPNVHPNARTEPVKANVTAKVDPQTVKDAVTSVKVSLT